MKVIKIEEIEKPKTVYTLECKNNHNYIANGMVVKNCQGASGAVIQSLISEAGRHIKYRYGLTGTMPKEEINKININNVLGEVVYTVTAKTLIEQGYLVDLHIQVNQLVEDFKSQYDSYIDNNPNSKIRYTKFKDSYFPDYVSEKSYIRTCPERLDYIAIDIINKSQLGNVFALVDNIQFGKKLEKIIKSKLDNEHIYFVSGKDDVKNRQKIYDLFADNDNIIVLATVHCAGVGIDIARIYELFLIDLGKSFIRTIQAIGRGLRPAPDKKFVNITDICSDLKYSKRHVAERIKFYAEAEYPYTKTKVTY